MRGCTLQPQSFVASQYPSNPKSPPLSAHALARPPFDHSIYEAISLQAASSVALGLFIRRPTASLLLVARALIPDVTHSQLASNFLVYDRETRGIGCVLNQRVAQEPRTWSLFFHMRPLSEQSHLLRLPPSTPVSETRLCHFMI